MNFVIKIAYSLILIFTVKMNSAFSGCANQLKSVEILDAILRDSQRLQRSLLSNGFYRSLDKIFHSQAEPKTCASHFSNHFLQNLRHLLYNLETERECTFDEMKWTWIKRKIKLAQGMRVTEENQPDVYTIPNFLSENQCEKLVGSYEDIRQSIATR